MRKSILIKYKLVMKKTNASFVGLYLLINLFTVISSNAQIEIETSGVSVFWEVADTLMADKEPSVELWEKFSNHPAYIQIQKSGNRVKYLKHILPIVFRPSQAQKLKEILEGKESFYQFIAKHLHEVKTRRKALDIYLESGKINGYKNAYLRSLNYLPADINEQTIDLTIHIALFEDNGFGGRVITMDLLTLMNGTEEGNMNFFGHEFHHALLKKSPSNKLFQPKDSVYYPVIRALNKFPLEGVASMIDKKLYFNEAYVAKIQSLDVTQKETVIEFRNLVDSAHLNLEKIDVVLSSDLANKEKEQQIFKSMPWSGHVIGFYMASAIEKVFGRDMLIEVQYSSIDFLKSYQKASKTDETLYSFSDKSMEFLKSIK